MMCMSLLVDELKDAPHHPSIRTNLFLVLDTKAKYMCTSQLMVEMMTMNR